MPVDGLMLFHLKEELSNQIVGDRVDKIYQPSKEELLFFLRGKEGVHKLFVSAKVQSPRVHLTNCSFENPSNPPMLCMLFRKHLSGAKIIAVKQLNAERILSIVFSTRNELGDPVLLTLYVEIMGRNSNIILVGDNGKIIDAVKRVDFETSPMRPILPGVLYESPAQMTGRVDVLSATTEEILHLIQSKQETLIDVLAEYTQGISMLLCREIAFRVCNCENVSVSSLDEKQMKKLETVFSDLKTKEKSITPQMLINKDGKPFDFSIYPIKQYGDTVIVEVKSSVSQLLDDFYMKKDEKERLSQQAHDLYKIIKNSKERILKRIFRQEKDIQEASKKEQKRKYGDLLTANLYMVKKGMPYIEVSDYFEEECPMIRIPLDVTKTASQNAQKYYKEYRKAQVAEKILVEQIEKGKEEIAYLDSVEDTLSRITSSKEIFELRDELISTGYLKGRGTSKKAPASLLPKQFVSSDGFTIYVGRNNRQNDLLTLKTARGNDLWFHTKNIPGSHVILETKGAVVPNQSIEEAAVLAAFHSKASASSQVPVDYTLVKRVHKPNGARPGKVIYEDQKTLYVTPDKSICEKLTT